jgi:hypothetical protein
MTNQFSHEATEPQRETLKFFAFLRVDKIIFVRYSFPLRGKDGMRAGPMEAPGLAPSAFECVTRVLSGAFV